jgi:hypothetical protein
MDVGPDRRTDLIGHGTVRKAPSSRTLLLFDAAGLGLVCVPGTLKALDHGLAPICDCTMSRSSSGWTKKVTPAAASGTARNSHRVNAATGVAPRMRSRTMPPPTAGEDASTSAESVATAAIALTAALEEAPPPLSEAEAALLRNWLNRFASR